MPLGVFSPLLKVKATKAIQGVSAERRALTNDNCLKEGSVDNCDLRPIYSILVVLIWEGVCKGLCTALKAMGCFSTHLVLHLPPQDPLVLS